MGGSALRSDTILTHWLDILDWLIIEMIRIVPTLGIIRRKRSKLTFIKCI